MSVLVRHSLVGYVERGQRTRGQKGNRASLLVPFVSEHVSLLEGSQRRIYCIGLLWPGTTTYGHTIMVYELYVMLVLINGPGTVMGRPG